MKINDEIVRAYLTNNENPDISGHWVYKEVLPGEVTFSRFPFERSGEVKYCYEKLLDTCENFKMYNEDLVRNIFGDIASDLENLNVLFSVHIPQPYDAMVRNRDDKELIIIDIGNFCEYIANGHDVVKIARNLLTHEFVHVLIHKKYPLQTFSYKDELDYIAFDEGFAHVLSFNEDIINFKPGDDFPEKFAKAKNRLAEAISETDPERQKQFILEANTGKFWDKYASVASMLYLTQNLGSLKEIYTGGWKNYCKKIIE